MRFYSIFIYWFSTCFSFFIFTCDNKVAVASNYRPISGNAPHPMPVPADA